MKHQLLLCGFATLALTCATLLLEGDRYFRAGNLVQAEAAYRAYLTGGRTEPDVEARARYRLGWIYALPGELHDWDNAVTALETLIRRQPDSVWAQQAEYLLDLHQDREDLAQILEDEREQSAFLKREITRIEGETEQAETEILDGQENLTSLRQELAASQRSIADLTQQLAERQDELERIKRIDLETPP